MKILFVMDRPEALDLRWDSSLLLLRELARRGHQNWVADVTDLGVSNKVLSVKCREVRPRPNGYRISWPQRRKMAFFISSAKNSPLKTFDLVLIRKEPPVDKAYLEATRLLEKVAGKILILNHPAGIRNNNEKLVCLHFPKWIPKTFVSSDPAALENFYDRLGQDVVIKPLDQKGGKGVSLIRKGRLGRSLLGRRTQNGRRKIIAQAFIPLKKGEHEKRVLLLDGKFLSVYEKHTAPGEFRANIGLGGKFLPGKLNLREKKLCQEVGRYCLKQGLRFVGLDVRAEKLIEINLTCPAGVYESTILFPRLRPLEVWTRSLERLQAGFSSH